MFITRIGFILYYALSCFISFQHKPTYCSVFLLSYAEQDGGKQAGFPSTRNAMTCKSLLILSVLEYTIMFNNSQIELLGYLVQVTGEKRGQA